MTLATGLAALAGAILASGVNAAVYAWRRHPLPYSPWSHLHPPDPRASILDFFPFVGWFRLRRHGGEWGRIFWLRPLAVELLLALLYGGLYWREIEQLRFPLATFLAHAVLVACMAAATFIDIDEWTIPDRATVPGTLLAIVFAFVAPTCLLPAALDVAPSPPAARLDIVTATAPFAWPGVLTGSPNVASLAIGWGCYAGWCAALLPRLWLPERGWNKALRMFLAHIARSRASARILAMFVVGAAYIAVAWLVGGERWTAVLTSLIGLAVSGAVVWYVRIVGEWAMGKEAMGFGDVTLMATIGAFLGWQAGVLVFFLAPLAAIGVSVVRLALWRDRSLPFGPYLCVTAVVLIAWWPPVWTYIAGLNEIAWLVPVTLGGCMACLGPLMYIVRKLSNAIAGPDDSAPAIVETDSLGTEPVAQLKEELSPPS